MTDAPLVLQKLSILRDHLGRARARRGQDLGTFASDLDRGLAADLRRLTALRDRLAHGYAGVDTPRLWHELPVGFDALDRFAAAIAGRLAP